MAVLQKFRSALNGFNREDVVRYIEYTNARHEAEVNRLREEVESLRRELEAQAPASQRGGDGKAEDLAQKCQLLEQENSELREQLAAAQCRIDEASVNHHPTEAELAAYRRAERAERIAQARASQMYDQANGALADTAAKLDSAATRLGQLAEETMNRIRALQEAVTGSKQVLTDGAAALTAIRPGTEEN